MAKNNLPKLKQIQGGLQLQSDVKSLQQYIANLTASQVATTVEDGKGGYLNAAQVLSNLLSNANTNNADIEEMKTDILNLENTAIADYVRLTGKVSVTVTELDDETKTYDYVSEFDEVEQLAELRAQALEVNNSCILYTESNTVVVDEHGLPVTINLANNVLSAKLFVADITNVESDTLSYVPIAEDFTFKVFPVGNYTLSTLPAEFLLDNQEMKAVYYQNAIDELAFQISKNSDLIAYVQEMIGTKTVAQAIADLRSEVMNFANGAHDELDEKISTLSNTVNNNQENHQKDFDALDARVTTTENQINTLNDSADVTGSVAHSIAQANAPILQRVTINENKLTVLNSGAETNGSVANSIKNVTDPMKAATSALETRMTNAESKINVLNSDETVTGSVMNSIKSVTNPIQTQVDTNEDRLDTAEEEIDALQAGLKSTDELLATTVDETNRAHTRLDNLDTGLNTTNETLARLDEKEETWDAQSFYTNETPIVTPIGQIEAGDTFNSMPITDLLTKILYPYVKPVINTFTSSTEGIKEVGEIFNPTDLSVAFTKKSEAITEVNFYVNNTKVNSVTEGLDTANYVNYSYETDVTTNTTFKAEVKDAKGTSVTASKTVSFYSPAFLGIVAENVEIDEAIIEGLAKYVQAPATISALLNKCVNSKIVVALPPTWTLSSIVDNNGFDVFNAFTKSTIEIVGLDNVARNYNLYVSNVCSIDAAVTYKFVK